MGHRRHGRSLPIATVGAMLCLSASASGATEPPFADMVDGIETISITNAGWPGVFVQIDERFPIGQNQIDSIRGVQEVAIAAGFRGEISISLGGFSFAEILTPDMAREGYGARHGESALWPIASVTKQQLAWRMVGELDKARLSLDRKISEFVPGISGSVTVPTLRQLLQHRSGLRNPDDTPLASNGWPEFYTKPEEYGLEWCLEGRSAPPASGWSYNNCDYIVLGAAFEELSFETVEYMLAGVRDESCQEGESCEPIYGSVFLNSRNIDRYYQMRSPEREVLPSYGASGALGMSLNSVAFANDGMMRDYDKLTGARAEFWKGDPQLGYMALGHWVFRFQPEGCDAPVLVSQRKGEIGQYRIENIMLPELRRSMVFATVKTDFEFGEIWAGQGFLPEAVAKLACGASS